ncbi:hypothetical protein JTB14_017855 [Gonioctena quinquepunctata]|nr:hypothetical protein JTB14_017855 [Gonioctena quinquepunctata]
MTVCLEKAELKALEAQMRAKAWLDTNKLSLNPDKTQKNVFALRSISDTKSQEESVKFLGIHFDLKLKWDIHTGKICKKLSSTIFLLRNLAGSVSPDTLKNAYHALFHPTMTYGIIAWGMASTARRAIRILANLQYREDCMRAFRDLNIMTFPATYIYACVVYVKENKGDFITHRDNHNYPTRHGNDLRAAFCRLKKNQARPNFTGVPYFNK